MIHESPIPTSLSLAGRNSAWIPYCKRRIRTRLGHSVCRTRVSTPRTLHLEVTTVVYCTHIAFVGPHYTQWDLPKIICIYTYWRIPRPPNRTQESRALLLYCPLYHSLVGLGWKYIHWLWIFLQAMNSLKPTNEWFSGAQLGENRPDGLKEEMNGTRLFNFFERSHQCGPIKSPLQYYNLGLVDTIFAWMV